MMKNKLIGTAVLTSTLLGGAGVTTAFAATPHNTAVKQISNYHGPHTAELAKSLGISETKLKAALDTVHKNAPKDNNNRDKSSRPQGQPTHDNHLADIAKKLGVSESKVKSVLDANKPTSRDAKPDFAKIAKALGVSEAKVKEAFAPHNANGKDRPKGIPSHNHNDKFSKDLAKALNMNEDKVKAALDSNRPSHMRGGDRGKNRF